MPRTRVPDDCASDVVETEGVVGHHDDTCEGEAGTQRVAGRRKNRTTLGARTQRSIMPERVGYQRVASEDAPARSDNGNNVEAVSQAGTPLLNAHTSEVEPSERLSTKDVERNSAPIDVCCFGRADVAANHKETDTDSLACESGALAPADGKGLSQQPAAVDHQDDKLIVAARLDLLEMVIGRAEAVNETPPLIACCVGRADVAADHAEEDEEPLADEPASLAAAGGHGHILSQQHAATNEASCCYGRDGPAAGRAEKAKQSLTHPAALAAADVEAARLDFEKKDEELRKEQQKLGNELRECAARIDTLRQDLAQEEETFHSQLDEISKGTDWLDQVRASMGLASEESSLGPNGASSQSSSNLGPSDGTAAKLVEGLKKQADIAGQLEMKTRERDFVSFARVRFEHEVQLQMKAQTYLKQIDCLWHLQATGTRHRRAARKFLQRLRPEDLGKLSLTSVVATNLLLTVVCSIMIMMMPSNIVKTFMASVVAMCYMVAVVKENQPVWKPYSLVGVYLMCLTIIPSVLVSSGSASGAALGAFMFLASLWIAGWAFLWYHAEKSITPIEDRQKLIGMPPGQILLKMKLLSVAAECYNLCGFSFFPALPWKAMQVPPHVPNPTKVMMAGLLEFGNVDINFWAFVGSTALVVLAFAMLYLTRSPEDIGRNLLITQVFFDLMGFPLVKKLTSVFSCTSALIWEKDEGVTKRFCDLPGEAQSEAQCMDNDPSTACWGSEHLQYVAGVMVLLVPYYLATLHLQLVAQKRQSVVAVDGMWTVVASQTKFFLAVVASAFGDCHPFMLVTSMELVVMMQLVLLQTGIEYSSVLQMNAIRQGGLVCAAMNGFYALYVLQHYSDDPAAGSTCATSYDQQSETHSSFVLGSESGSVSTRLVTDYTTFFCLLTVNLLGLAYGFKWYYDRKKQGWETKLNHVHESSWDSTVNSSSEKVEVDFPIVRMRLQAVDILCTEDTQRTPTQQQSHADEENPNVTNNVRNDHRELFHLTVSEGEGQQQLEGSTLNLVMDNENLKESERGVHFLEFDAAQPGGLLLCDLLSKLDRKRWYGCSADKPLARVAGITVSKSADLRAIAKVAGLLFNQLSKHNGFLTFYRGNTPLTLDFSHTPKAINLPVEFVEPERDGRPNPCIEVLRAWVYHRHPKVQTISFNLVATNFGDAALATLLTQLTDIEDLAGGNREDKASRSLCGSKDVTGVQKSMVSSLCGVVGQQTEMDFADRGLQGLTDCKIVAAELLFFRSETTKLNINGNRFGEECAKVFATIVPVVTSMNCINNPLGEGVHTIIKAFEETPRLRTLCGFEEGVEQIDWSGSEKGPVDVALLSADIKVGRASVAVARLILDENPLTGGRYSSDFDKDITGVMNLCDALKTSCVTELSLAKCRLGPGSLGKLAEYVRDAEAAINLLTLSSTGNMRDQKTYTLTAGEEKIDLSQKNLGSADVTLLTVWLQRPEVMAALNSLKCGNNPGMVGELHPWGELKTPDAHAEVFKQLTDNLKTSQVTEVDFSSCGIGPVALGHLSEWVRDAEAAVNSVTVDGNPIGCPSGASVKPGAVTGIEVKKGVFAAVDGRFGEVDRDVPGDKQIKLTWLDNDQKSGWIEVDKLTSVVASRTDLIEDYTHIRSLGEALSSSKVQTYGFANCKFNPVSLATFVESVRWADAALNSVTVDSTGDTKDRYRNWNNGGPKTYTLTVGDEKINLGNKNLGSADVALLAAWLQRPEVSAALNEVNVAFNQIGSEGGIALRDALKTSNVKFITIGKMYLSAGGAVITGSQLTTGVTLCSGGRLGELAQGPNSALNVKLKWTDTGELSNWMKLNSLDGEPLKLPLQSPFEGEHLDLAHQQLDPGYVLLLSWWLGTEFSAAVEVIAIGANPIGSEGGAILLETIKTSKLKTIDIGKPLPLQEPYESDTLDLSNTMDPGHVLLLSWWLGTEFSAAVASLRCANNLGMVGKLDHYGRLETPDAHAGVFKELTDSLKTSQVTEADFSSCGLGPVALGHLSDWVREATAALTSINCLANNFDDDGLATLLTAIEGTSVRSLCGLTERQTTADFSAQNLKPMDCKIIAAEFEFRGFIAALNSLKCGNNPGMVGELEYSRLKTPDAHAEVFKQLTDNLKTSQVTEADFSSCGLGPVALGHLSEWVRDAEAALTKIDVRNNGLDADSLETLKAAASQECEILCD